MPKPARPFRPEIPYNAESQCIQPYISYLPLCPQAPLHTQFDGRGPPILSMVMALLPKFAALTSLQPRPGQALLLVHDRQQPKDDWHPDIQLHFHQPMTDSIADVLEVHGLAFYQDAYRNDGVKRLLQRRRGPGGIRLGGRSAVRLNRIVRVREVGSTRTHREEVCCGGGEGGESASGSGGGGLKLRSGIETTAAPTLAINLC